MAVKLNEKQKKWILIAGVLIIVVIGGFFAIRALFPGEKVVEGPQYTTAAVSKGNIDVGVEATGSLNAGYGGSIMVPNSNDEKNGSVTYNIREVKVKNGDTVKAGSTIMVLGAPSLSSQIGTLQDQLNAERKSLASMLNIPISQVDNASVDKGITVTAPIAGRLNLTAKNGAKITQGELIGKIVDDSSLEIVANLTAYEIGTINNKTKAIVSTISGMNSTIEAKIVDVNRNAVPTDSSTLIIDSGIPQEMTGVEFTYEVTLQVKNPGLLQPGKIVSVGFYEPKDGYVFKAGDIPGNISWNRYMSKISKYVNEEEIFSTVEGVITKVVTKNNSIVKKGDGIVNMAGQDVKDEIEKRLESIRKKKTELAQSQDKQGSLTIVSPSDGIVDGFDKKQGGTVNAGEYCGQIFSSSNMNMSVQVDDTDVLLIQVGAPVKVTIDALPDQPFEGKVEYIGGYGGGGNSDSGGVTRYEVGITVQGSGEIRPGMQARAYIDSGSASDVLLAPIEAIFREDGVDKVEVLNPDGSISVVAVEVGLMNSRQAEIRSGLEEGQLVITGSTADVLPSQNGGGSTLLPGQTPDDSGDTPTTPEEDPGAVDNGDATIDGGGEMVSPDVPVSGGTSDAVAVPVGFLDNSLRLVSIGLRG